jgi:quinol monooxygenase YgiN
MNNTDHVSWLFELKLEPGALDDWRELMQEMVASTLDEPGTLDYEWSISEDGTICHIWERYADSDATMVHNRMFDDKFAPRFTQLSTATRLVVFGNPSEKVKENLAPLNPVYLRPLGGFSR